MEPFELSDKVRSDPRVARAEIVAALDAAQGELKGAAERLRVSKMTLYRYVRTLGMLEEVEALRTKYAPVLAEKRAALNARAGRFGGWPKGRKRKVV